MTKVSDAQLVVLSAACQRPDRNLLPLPERIKGGAAHKIIASLIGKALIEELGSGLPRVQNQTNPRYTLSGIGELLCFAARLVAEELSLIQSPDAPTPGEKSGLAVMNSSACTCRSPRGRIWLSTTKTGRIA
jgi:hypothetical protein